MKPVVSRFRAVRAALAATAAQLSRRRLATLAAGVVILVAFGLWAPLPSALQLRDWATSVGPWFPVAFFLAHVLVTVFPFPRTAFTLAAGLLFGPVFGVSLAVAASTVSAVVAMLLIRSAGWHLGRLVTHPGVDSLNTRLKERGWPTVLSVRMIPVVPFSVINYAAGSSAVRVVPYTLATLAGLLPGTAAVVILGDAFTGHVNPLLILVSVATATLGVAGLGYEIRTHRRSRSVSPPEAQPADPVISTG